MGKAVINNGIMESYEFTMPGNVKITVEEGVKAFGERCFFEQKKLTKLILPGTLESLGGWCLSGTGIKKLEVPEGARSITDHAVANCRSLKSVRLPSTLTELSGNCFENCPQLEEVLLAADGLEFNPAEVFRNCPQVTVSITDRDGEPIRKLYTGAEVGKMPDPADQGVDSFSIRNDVLTEVILPEGEAVRVTLPSGIRRCDSKLLKDEERVTELSLPEGLEELTGWEFAGTGIREVRLPEGLQRLEGHVFADCKELRRVIVPASVREIRGEVFAGCPYLEAILYEGEPKDIQGNVFAGSPKPLFVPCSGENAVPEYPEEFTVTDGVLEAVDADAVEDGRLTLPYGIRKTAPELLKDRSEITELILPPGLEELTGYAFSGTAIREIRLPESLVRLDGQVFENCTELETVVLPESMTALRGELFRNCPKLRYIFYGGDKLTCDDTCFDEGKTPELLYRRPRSERHDWLGKTFSDALFDVRDGVLLRYKGDESITEVDIPEGVQCIAVACFKDMTHITAVSFPDTLRELVGWEFVNTGLKEVYIPDNLHDLDGHCFEGCKNLKTVYLPRNMSRFGTEGSCYCFRSCEQLEKVYYASEKVTYFNSAFEGCPHFLVVQKFWDKAQKSRKAALPASDADTDAPQTAPEPDTAAELPPEDAPAQTSALPAEDMPDAAADNNRQTFPEPSEEAAETTPELHAEMDRLRREVGTLRSTVRTVEERAAEAERRAEKEILRRQLEAAAAEKERLQAEMTHREVVQALKEQSADLQTRLRIAETKYFAVEAAMEQMLLAFAEDAPAESHRAMLLQLQKAAAELVTGNADAAALLCNELNNGEAGDTDDIPDDE